jgi:diguanylate cyclase (GGDEF)-like protein
VAGRCRQSRHLHQLAHDRLLGRPASQLLGHSLPSLLGGMPSWAVLLERSRSTRSKWSSRPRAAALDLDRRRSDHRHRGRFEGFRGVGSDITEIRQTQERLTHLANVDVLSGLPNRGRVRQLLGEALRAATVGNVPCAIMFLDLDGFKPVNDTFGHPKGDAVLQAVAKRWSTKVGADGHVGRMGGDEFAIVVTDAQSRRKVEQLADRIIKAIAEPYMIDQTEIRIGVSIGCAFGPIDGATVDDLILKADLALYQAKDAGRGVARYFSSELQSEQEDRVRLEPTCARRSPPSSSTSSSSRWSTPRPEADRLRGADPLEPPAARLVPPNVFIPVAEEAA